MQQLPLRTRIAPTPSGYLHLGNVLSFAITWAVARQRQGTIILRVDDLDDARFRMEYLQDIFDTLAFMGLDYDEGPQSPVDFLEHYSQHQRLPRYHALLQRLTEGGHVYACPCSRRQLAALPGNTACGLHSCRHQRQPLQQPGIAWRVFIPEDTMIKFTDRLLQHCTVPLGQEMPDFVVRRKEGIPAYQIASLADDLDLQVNIVVRGEDLLSSTAAQLYLAQRLHEEQFLRIQFVHHPLVQDPAGGKLSKSHDSLSVSEMRQGGMRSEALWRHLARMLGWNEPVASATDFLDRFRLEELQPLSRHSLHP